MKYLIGFFRFIFLVIIELLLFCSVGILSIHHILPHFIKSEILVLPNIITKYVPQKLIMDNLYDERFVIIILIAIALLFLLTLIISLNPRKSMFVMSIPFLFFGGLLVSLNNFSFIMGIYLNAEDLFKFGIVKQDLLDYSFNFGIILLIVGAIFFIIFIIYLISMVTQIIDDHEKKLSANEKNKQTMQIKIRNVK